MTIGLLVLGMGAVCCDGSVGGTPDGFVDTGDGAVDGAPDASVDDGGRDASVDDAGPDASVDDGGPDASVDDGGLGDGDASVDDGGVDAGGDSDQPPNTDVPGGLLATSPVVGCEDADRPARRVSGALPEVCEAEGAGRCWYADPTVPAGGDGSFESPFRVPQEAVQRAAPGDVIYLRGGVYDETTAHVGGVNSWEDESAGTRDYFLSIMRISLPAWTGQESYSVATGTAEAPIRIRSYPNERACLEGSRGIQIGSLAQDMAHWEVEGLTLRHGSVAIQGGVRSGDTTHHITLRYMEISHHQGRQRNNVGLIKINRGDWGGPHDITIESNILHELSVVDTDGIVHDPLDGLDAQHFGAVTTLSCETYIDPACGGNGALTIRNNHIYRVPSAFFFKNPTLGPILIDGNVIHDISYLGQWSASNITFQDNLVYGHGSGARLGGFGGSTADPVWERSGRNLKLLHNTFIDKNRVVTFRIYAKGHTFRANVYHGLKLSLASDANWDHMGAFVEAHPWVHPDTADTIEQSRLAQNDFDDNCFVTDVEDFIAYGRRYAPEGAPEILWHLGLQDARELLGHESTSDHATDAASVFVDFEGGDYRVDPDGPCAGRGAAVPDWMP